MKATSSDIRRRLEAADRASFNALAAAYAARHAGRIIGLDDMRSLCDEHRAAVQRYIRDRDSIRAFQSDLRGVFDIVDAFPPSIEDLPGVSRETIDRLPDVLLTREGAAAIFQGIREAVFRQVQDPADRRAYNDEADRIFRRYFDDRRRGDE